jgi:flagellar biosynthesis protein FliR
MFIRTMSLGVAILAGLDHAIGVAITAAAIFCAFTIAGRLRDRSIAIGYARAAAIAEEERRELLARAIGRAIVDELASARSARVDRSSILFRN